MPQSIRIRQGVKVQSERTGLITLIGDVYVEAQREPDGCWLYELRGTQYRCAGGLAEVL